MLPMVTGCPFLLQVTVVAGEPVEVQVRVEDGFEACEVNAIIVGGAGRKHHSLNEESWIAIYT